MSERLPASPALDSPSCHAIGRWSLVWIALWLIAPLCLAAWRAQFGADLSDEGYYVVPSLRYVLGDRPYRDEWWTTVTGFDLLLWPLFLIWPTIPLFALRLAGLALYAASMIPVVVWLRREIGAVAAVIAGLCLWAGAFPLTISTPSYNLIPAALLPAAVALALLSADAATRRRTWLFGCAAGLAHGLAAVAYRPCLGLVVFPGLLLTAGVLRRNWRGSAWHAALSWLA
ncbi:MAG: hypothetical protein AAB676_11590, partial [Verrucomicrobiota bacterium]